MFVSPPNNNIKDKRYSIPYGIIPKKRKNQQQRIYKEEKDMTCCNTKNEISTSVTSYIISVFNNYFGNVQNTTKKSTKLINKNGLMPHTPKRKTDAFITPQTVTAPIAMIGGVNTHDNYDDYLSKSDSSTDSSLGSSFSSISSVSNNNNNNNNHRGSVSSLSEILCDHYVQKALNNSNNNNNEVPLETYKVFEATRRRSSTSSQSSSLTLLNNEEAREDDDDESWFIWDNLQKTKEWIQVVDEELFLPKEKTSTEIAIVEQPPQNRRGIRANPAHLRMIVAEVNMMRCNKIVGPLKSRGFLPPRTDTFISNQSSPLRLPIY